MENINHVILWCICNVYLNNDLITKKKPMIYI